MVPILCSVGPPHARASPFGAVSDFQARHSEITVASGGGRTAGRDCNHIAPTQTGAQRLIRAYWHPTLPVVLPVARCSHHFGLHTSTRSESPRLCCGRQPPRCGFSGLARPLMLKFRVAPSSRCFAHSTGTEPSLCTSTFACSSHVAILALNPLYSSRPQLRSGGGGMIAPSPWTNSHLASV